MARFLSFRPRAWHASSFRACWPRAAGVAAAPDNLRWWPLLAVLLFGGCGDNIELPQKPTIDSGRFLPIVREQIDEALEAVDSKPHSAEANGHLALLLHCYKQWESAEVMYRRARLLAPRDLRWTYGHGLVLKALGRHDEAIAVLGYAHDRAPSDTGVALELALLHLGNDDLASCRRLLDTAVEHRPDSAKAHFIYGRLLSRTGEHELAIEHLSRAIRLSGDFGTGHYVLAQAWRELGNEELVARHLALSEKYRGVGGTDHDPLLAEVTALDLSDVPLIRQARVEADHGRVNEAIDMLNEALRRNPESLAAHVTLIGLYGTQREFDRAEEHIARAAAIDPDRSKLHYNIGLTRVMQQRYADAVDAFEKARQLDDMDPNPHVQLGAIHHRQGRLDDAVIAYREALRRDPTHRQARWLTGDVLVRQGRFDEAIEHLQRAREPEDQITPLVLESLIRAQTGAGDLEAARATLDEAIRLAHLSTDAGLRTRLDATQRELAEKQATP